MMKAAIIGTGGIAKIHANAIQLLGGSIAGVAGNSLESARKFGEGTPYDDVEVMLGEQKPDVVHVCSPNHFDKAHAISSFAAGAHVLCEKPRATSIADGQEMIEAARGAQRVPVVMYHNRGYPLPSHEGASCRRRSGSLAAHRRLLSERRGPVSRPVDWHFISDRAGRSFAMMDIGVHWTASRRIRHRATHRRDRRVLHHSLSIPHMDRTARSGSRAGRPQSVCGRRN